LEVAPDPGDPGYASRAGFKLAGVLDALAGSGSGSGAGSPGGRPTVPDGGLPRVPVVGGARCLDLGAWAGGVTDVLLRRGARVVGDLSFISLAMVLPAVVGVVGPGTDLLLLVKPQFEVGRERLGSGGVVRDPALHVEVVVAVARHAAVLGLRAVAVVPSPLPGPSGNREYFWWLRAGEPGRADGMVLDDAALEDAAAAAVAWQPSP